MGGSTWVFAGPPRYDSEDAWSSAEVRSWAADCTKWLKKRSGKGSRIAHCALHQDEAAPHLHVTVIVADEQGRLGWNRIRKNFGVEGKTSGVLLMSGLQDNFSAAVGSKHGLDRGEVGSNREHAPVDRARGVKIRVEEERQRSHEARVLAGQRIAGVMVREEAVTSRETAVVRQKDDLERRDSEIQVREAAVEEREKGVDGLLTKAEEAVTALVKRAEKAETGLRFERADRWRLERDLEKVKPDIKKAVDDLAAAEERGRKKGEEGVDAAVRKAREQAKRAADERVAAAERAAAKRAFAAAGRAANRVAAAGQDAADRVARATKRIAAAVDLVVAAEAERNKALKDVKTRTTERNDARTERDQAQEEVRTVRAERNRAFGSSRCLLKVLQELGPGRGELEGAADRAGLDSDDKQGLADDVLDRGRGRGLDR